MEETNRHEQYGSRFEVTHPRAVRPASVIIEHSLNFDLEAGETVFVETRTTMGLYAGHVRPDRVNASTGTAGVSKCKNTGG